MEYEHVDSPEVMLGCRVGDVGSPGAPRGGPAAVLVRAGVDRGNLIG